MPTPEIDRLRAGIAVLLDLLVILYRQSPDKEKILACFQKETESLSSELLYTTFSEEYLATYKDYRDIVVNLLKLQRKESSGG